MKNPTEINCKHYKLKGSGYIYDIGEQNLNLCDKCNLILAGQLMQQFAIEHFAITSVGQPNENR